MSEALLEAVRGLHVADPDLGVKPLLAKLREQQPDLGAGNKEVREALIALKAEGEAKAAAAAADAAATAGRSRCSRRHAARCRRGRRAFERGAEPRLHRLLPAAVGHGRRPGKAPDLRKVPR
eukprot:scaffold23974_cov53-Phaeocystis_antarctica.AAC.1